MPDRATLSALSVLVVAAAQEDVAKIQDGLPAGSTFRQVDTFSFSEISTDILRSTPDLLIISSASVDLEDIATAERLASAKQLPIIWFVERDDEGLAPHAVRAGVTSFVVDGLTPSRIASLITVALERHRLVTALHGELQKSKDSLAARKIVERAKGLLMQTRGMSEEEAYKTLRSMAMRQGKSLKSVCDALISMSDLLP